MVYKNPPANHKKVVQEICDKSLRIVVLAEVAKKLLVNQYQVLPRKIEVIKHGAPNVPKYSTGFFKEMVGFNKEEILVSSFGLVRPKKGYEYLIEAIAAVKKKYPNIKLLIAGRAHPQRSPEYYKLLKDKVKELKLSDNVVFVNKFIDYSELLNYLMATNVFVAPFTVMEQVSSGTLIYAMAAGRACISTPFDYAKEALADKRGILVPPCNSKDLANKIVYLIKHPKVRHRMENESYKYARQQTWSKTAKKYLSLFSSVADKNHEQK
jgi:glycosyltransferase involved in cell wall biosynthesis